MPFSCAACGPGVTLLMFLIYRLTLRKQFPIDMLSVLSCSFGTIRKAVIQLNYYGDVTILCGILEIIMKNLAEE